MTQQSLQTVRCGHTIIRRLVQSSHGRLQVIRHPVVIFVEEIDGIKSWDSEAQHVTAGAGVRVAQAMGQLDQVCGKRYLQYVLVAELPGGWVHRRSWSEGRCKLFHVMLCCVVKS